MIKPYQIGYESIYARNWNDALLQYEILRIQGGLKPANKHKTQTALKQKALLLGKASK